MFRPAISYRCPARVWEVAAALALLSFLTLFVGVGSAGPPDSLPGSVNAAESPTSTATTAPNTHTPTATRTSTPTPTQTATRTPTATSTAAPSATATRTSTPTSIPATHTSTPMATTAPPTNTPVPDAPTPEPSATPSPPANDDLDTPTSMGSFTFIDSLEVIWATSGWDDPDMMAGNGSNNNTVWYRFTVPTYGRIRLDTYGSDYDTVVAAYAGPRGRLTWIASNDDAPSPRESHYSTQSEMSFDVQPGVDYALDVASKYSGGGHLVLTVDFWETAAPTATALPASPTSPPLPTPFPTPTVVIPTPTLQVVPADERYFQPTGYRVGNDAFWDYFQRRGGLRTFGYPVSNEFFLLAFRVQFFQRAILQLKPDGSVVTMNLLDEGLMPYNQISFSVFPTADRDLIDAAPSPANPNYAEQAVLFLQANVPNQWEGLPVNFFSAFMSTVLYEDAFPAGDGEASLLPLLNLELWGLPTSKPAYDPNNGGFVYQRFQRGIMHYDASTGATQGLLLADYLKSIITGENLPPDLDEQARGSRFYRQYDAARRGGPVRPEELPATEMSGAFEAPIAY